MSGSIYVDADQVMIAPFMDKAVVIPICASWKSETLLFLRSEGSFQKS